MDSPAECDGVRSEVGARCGGRSTIFSEDTMAKSPITPPDAETTTETEACLRITAPAGPHWRGGLQFGREAVCLGEAEVAAAAKAKGLTADEFGALLSSDEALAIAPARRPKIVAAEA
jgi:hypothetical protein